MTSQLRDRVGQFGVWQGAAQGTPELAAGLEQLGYGTIWLGGSPGVARVAYALAVVAGGLDLAPRAARSLPRSPGRAGTTTDSSVGGPNWCSTREPGG